MRTRIKSAAVLGAGTMGAGIAAHLANCGIPTLLLDIVPPSMKDKDREAGLDPDSAEHRNSIAVGAIARMPKSKLAPLYDPADVRLLRPGNLDDHFDQLSDVDWIIEAVPEKMSIKQPLFERLESIHRDGQLITSNTSGLPLDRIIEGRAPHFSKHVFITHFFNPPRYMHLLELVAGSGTDVDIFDSFIKFAEQTLGKGVVIAKDTPNFIANRIGAFDMSHAMHLAIKMGLKVEEVDAIAGPALGRPKSAVFRLIDLVGVDITVYVGKNITETLKDDESIATFEPPAIVLQMIENGYLGQKAGQGFYKKTKDDNGRTVILPLDLETAEYRQPIIPTFESLGLAKKAGELNQRIQALVSHGDPAGLYAWDLLSSTICYSARRIPEISDSISAVDDAMRWGYNWELGPFETWDALGIQAVVDRLTEEGRDIPTLITDMLNAGCTAFYRTHEGCAEVYDHSSRGYVSNPLPQGVTRLNHIRRTGGVVHTEKSASILDLGDGVLCVEFHSRANSLSIETLDVLRRGVDEAEANHAALVIGNQGAHFCLGADLKEVMTAVDANRLDDISLMIRRFHETVLRLKHSHIPVVSAIHGMVLGGGVEISLQSDRIQAAPETYMGLVEVGVGLIPAGGGCKEWAIRCDDWSMGDAHLDLFPILNKGFMMVGMAETSRSAAHAHTMGYLRSHDGITMNKEALIESAKHKALQLVQEGYRPPMRRHDIRIAGRGGIAEFQVRLNIMRQGNYISDHDQHIANKLAHVLCGGDLPSNTRVSDQHILDLEHDAFLSLLGEPLTLARIEHILKTGKPLRN